MLTSSINTYDIISKRNSGNGANATSLPSKSGASEIKKKNGTAKLYQSPAANVGLLHSLAVMCYCVPIGSGLHFFHVTAGLGSKECLEVGITIQPRNGLT